MRQGSPERRSCAVRSGSPIPRSCEAQSHCQSKVLIIEPTMARERFQCLPAPKHSLHRALDEETLKRRGIKAFRRPCAAVTGDQSAFSNLVSILPGNECEILEENLVCLTRLTPGFERHNEGSTTERHDRADNGEAFMGSKVTGKAPPSLFDEDHLSQMVSRLHEQRIGRRERRIRKKDSREVNMNQELMALFQDCKERGYIREVSEFSPRGSPLQQPRNEDRVKLGKRERVTIYKSPPTIQTWTVAAPIRPDIEFSRPLSECGAAAAACPPSGSTTTSIDPLRPGESAMLSHGTLLQTKSRSETAVQFISSFFRAVPATLSAVPTSIRSWLWRNLVRQSIGMEGARSRRCEH